MTITIQIGNSDDKLSQMEWSEYIHSVAAMIEAFESEVHFFACSDGSCEWQNAAWVIALHEDQIKGLRENLSTVREGFRQDSIAWTEGSTQFV